VRQRDLNGLVINCRAAAQIYPTLDGRRVPPRALADRVKAGHVGVTVGRGFYRWDKRTLGAWLQRYERVLGELLKLMREGIDEAAPPGKRSRGSSHGSSRTASRARRGKSGRSASTGSPPARG
jgi:3-hydroxyacyl-CoA dehydrogenase